MLKNVLFRSMAAQVWSWKIQPSSRGKSHSSCLGPFTSDSPRSTKQFSLHVSEHLVHTEHYCNLISKNTIIAQCSKAIKRVLLITFSPTAAVFCFQTLRLVKGNWSSSGANTSCTSTTGWDLLPGFVFRDKNEIKNIMRWKPDHCHSSLCGEAAGN